MRDVETRYGLRVRNGEHGEEIFLAAGPELEQFRAPTAEEVAEVRAQLVAAGRLEGRN